MPVVLRVRLLVAGGVHATSRGAHAVLCRWLDAPEPSHEAVIAGEPDSWWPLGRPTEPDAGKVRAHDESVKSWALVGLETEDDVVTIDVSLFDQDSDHSGGLAGRLAQFAARCLVQPSSVERIGAHAFQVIPSLDANGSASAAEVLARATWQQLSHAPGSPTWSWNFLSSTAFRRGKQDDPLYDPRRILVDIARSWRAHAPAEVVDAVPEGWGVDASIDTLACDIRIGDRHDATSMGRSRSELGFTGTARHRLRPPRGKASVEVPGPLLAVASYVGVGTATTFGRGQVEVSWSGNPGERDG